jgi:hypothetical protein
MEFMQRFSRDFAQQDRENAAQLYKKKVVNISVYVPWDLSILDFFSRFIRFRIAVAMFPAICVFAVIVAVTVLVRVIKSFLK